MILILNFKSEFYFSGNGLWKLEYTEVDAQGRQQQQPSMSSNPKHWIFALEPKYINASV